MGESQAGPSAIQIHGKHPNRHYNVALGRSHHEPRDILLLCGLGGGCSGVAAQAISGSNAHQASWIETRRVVLDADEIKKQIDKTEKALDAIKGHLNTQTQTIAKQIRAFISHAHKALNDDDPAGAGVLSSKARVLLLELYRECSPQAAPKGKFAPI